MSMDIESRLRAALRPISPSDEFSQRLIVQVVSRSRGPAAKRWALSRRSTWLFSAGLAASLLLAVGVQYQLEQRARANGLEARRQVVAALRMTSQKLNLAYETVKSESL